IVSSSCDGEGFSNAIGEAMACGIPCVVTDVGDSAQIVGDIDLVVSPKNPQALATALQQLINLSATQRAELGLKARLRVKENFGTQRLVNETTAYLSNC
ncbi:MAG: glycosyltransferase, partial [Ferruginibacter sp.]|nr:glycosyltransferase [Ferruginibacter sp.]